MQCSMFMTARRRGILCSRGGHAIILLYYITSIIDPFYFDRLWEEASRIGRKEYEYHMDNGVKHEKADDIERKLSRIITNKELEIKAMDEKKMKMEEDIKKQAREIRRKDDDIKERDEKIEKQAEEIRKKDNEIEERGKTIEKQANDIRIKDIEIQERDMEIEKITQLEESMEVEENGSKNVLNGKPNEEIITKIIAENQELKDKVALNEQIEKQLDAFGHQKVKELQDKIELLQERKEFGRYEQRSASLKYQKLTKANDELKNKVQLYKEMVSLRDKVI